MIDKWRPLSKAILRKHESHPHRWLDWMLRDVLADFGAPGGEPPPKEAWDDVAELSGLYARCVAEAPPLSDLLGPLYMDLAGRAGRDVLAQFFTPMHVARFTAEMLLGVGSKERPDGRLITLCEPCAGSGVMVLAAAQVLLSRDGPRALRRWSFTTCDLDAVCARMAAVQLLANAASHGAVLGEIICYRGNALGPLERLEVLVHATAPEVPAADVAPAKAPERVEVLRKATRATPGRRQLSLFDDLEDEPTKRRRAA